MESLGYLHLLNLALVPCACSVQDLSGLEELRVLPLLTRVDTDFALLVSLNEQAGLQSLACISNRCFPECVCRAVHPASLRAVNVHGALVRLCSLCSERGGADARQRLPSAAQRRK